MLFSFIVYFDLLFLVIIIRGQDTFDCTGYEDDSYHPVSDADDCRHYWHCLYVDTVYMHAVRRVCPSGTEFDATLKQCETSGEVDCVPPKSPHGPRTSSTTKAWKWRYSKLFSRKRWKATTPSFFTTRKHRIFDLDQPVGTDSAPGIILDDTTEQFQVLPFTLAQPTTAPLREQLSNNFHAALPFHHRPTKNKLTANFFKPGEPGNEAELYVTTARPKRRTRSTTQSTFVPMTTLSFTTEDSTSAAVTITTTAVTATTTITTTTTTVTTSTSTTTNFVTTTSIETAPPGTPIKSISQARIGGHFRRKNMTLYILTSDEHKIRQFSVNHTRGILINCNQLRRRLLGRRLRDILLTSTNQPFIGRNSARLLERPSVDAVLFLTILALMIRWNGRS